MAKKLTRLLIMVIGLVAGASIWAGLSVYFERAPYYIHETLPAWVNLLIYIAWALLFGIIFFIIAPLVIHGVSKMIKTTEQQLARLSMSEIATGSLGLIVGLLVSFLLTGIIDNMPASWLTLSINILIYVTFVTLGISIAIHRKNELNMASLFSKKSTSDKEDNTQMRSLVLDTSVIIDGRIYDICKTGIIEGELVIPEFVLVELRHIADSSDDLKRGRGRRGLDIINMIQKDLGKDIKIVQKDYDDTTEVDSKLLKLAKEINAKIVTNDFNLNKVATVQGLPVININDLANAVKPIALPGEAMEVTIIKDGKERAQGIGYLDDGTMIVVEDGKGKVGQTLNVLVTSVLQTSAGRMIFAKIS